MRRCRTSAPCQCVKIAAANTSTPSAPKRPPVGLELRLVPRADATGAAAAAAGLQHPALPAAAAAPPHQRQLQRQLQLQLQRWLQVWHAKGKGRSAVRGGSRAARCLGQRRGAAAGARFGEARRPGRGGGRVAEHPFPDLRGRRAVRPGRGRRPAADPAVRVTGAAAVGVCGQRTSRRTGPARHTTGQRVRVSNTVRRTSPSGACGASHSRFVAAASRHRHACQDHRRLGWDDGGLDRDDRGLDRDDRGLDRDD